MRRAILGRTPTGRIHAKDFLNTALAVRGVDGQGRTLRCGVHDAEFQPCHGGAAVRGICGACGRVHTGDLVGVADAVVGNVSVEVERGGLVVAGEIVVAGHWCAGWGEQVGGVGRVCVERLARRGNGLLSEVGWVFGCNLGKDGGHACEVVEGG